MVTLSDGLTNTLKLISSFLVMLSIASISFYGGIFIGRQGELVDVDVDVFNSTVLMSDAYGPCYQSSSYNITCTFQQANNTWICYQKRDYYTSSDYSYCDWIEREE